MTNDQKWNAVLDVLDTRRKTVFAHYQHARILSFTDTALELGFASSYELADLAKDQADVVRQILRELAGRDVKVAVKIMTAAESAATPARSIVEESKARGDDERRKRESEAREHPMTRLVLETFGAAIKEIKTDV